MFTTGNTKSVEKLPLIDAVTPYNVQLSGFYKRSFAYFTIKERLPVIITKVIDHLSKDRDEIANEFGVAAKEDVKTVIAYLSKLKNEIQTNKKLEPLTVDAPDRDEWNSLVNNLDDPFYFTCVWLFSECYVYRRIREAFQLTSVLTTMDPFRVVKDASFMGSMMAMCQVANRVTKILTDATVTQEDFQLMLRMNLWGNKCDLSLSVGKEVSQNTDPVSMVETLHSNIIVDHSREVFEALCRTFLEKKDKEIIVDIVCDNSGYELYTDLCFADYLITKRLATTVRFHVKAVPWFVSDATVRDVLRAVDGAREASFSLDMPAADGEPKQTLSAANVKYLGNRWQNYLKNGVWTCKDDHYWTTPHEFYKMGSLDKDLYNTLGQADMVLFKGDLNYRKLMGEVNWPPTTPFETALREFFPCPLVAVRTVKADLISGLPAGLQETLNARDAKWMETGDYGVIQFCTKKIVLAHELPYDPQPVTLPLPSSSPAKEKPHPIKGKPGKK